MWTGAQKGTLGLGCPEAFYRIGESAIAIGPCD